MRAKTSPSTAHLAIMQYFARDVIGFSEALALVFITLRLTGHIAWSWWLVLLPLYVWFVLTVALMTSMKALAHFKIWREGKTNRIDRKAGLSGSSPSDLVIQDSRLPETKCSAYVLTMRS